MGKKFQEIKDEILRRGYEANACDAIKRAECSESMEELAQVIKDNIAWCVSARVLDTKIISKYKKDFASVGIYANESHSDGYVVIDSEVDCLSGNAIAILYGNATVSRICGNAIVSRMCDNAIVKYASDNAIVNDMRDNAIVDTMYSNATVNYVRGNATINEMYGYATINEMYGYVVVNLVSGNATVKEMYGYAAVKEMRNNAAVKEMRNNAIVEAMHDNTIATVVSGNAIVKEMHDNAYLSAHTYLECKINDYAIMRVRSKNKIYTGAKVIKP